MEFELRSNRTFFYTKDLNKIKEMFEKCGMLYRESFFKTDSGAKYTLLKTRLRADETSKLVKNGCIKLVREKDHQTGDYYLRKSRKKVAAKKIKAKNSDYFKIKKVKIPEKISGFSGNMLTGVGLIFK